MTFAQQQEALLNRHGFANLLDGYDHAIKLHAGKAAFTCLGHTLTYAEFDRHCRAFAHYLKTETTLQPGDRVAIQLPNLCQYPIAAVAAWRAGLIVVNTNPLYTERELVHQFNDAGVKALIVLADLLPMTALVVPKTGISTVIATNATDLIDPKPVQTDQPVPGLISWSEATAVIPEQEMAKPALSMADTAVLQYTGGTTGVAKGAVLSHGNLFCAITQSREAVSKAAEQRGERQEVMISPMPLYHVYGFALSVVSGLLTGGHSVLIPNPRDTSSIVNAMKQHPFTGFAGVNTLFTALMMDPAFDSINFDHLDTTIAGGAALAEEVAQQWQQRTGSPILEGYGLTETAATTTLNRHDSNQIGTVGPPVPSTEIKLINESGQEVAPGEEGELCLRGPQVMQGYWNRAEASAEVLDADGWFRTGDIAVVLPEGHIKIVDRIKDMILVSGFNVYPNEIENVVYSYPGVHECAAVGVKNKKTGEAVKLFVATTNGDTTVDEIITFCRTQLAAYKVPRQIEFRDELPKSNVGKILRRALRD